MFDSVAPHVNLQRQQQGEEELVLLVQAPRRILEHLEGHKLDDVADALAGDRAFGGPVQVRFKAVLICPWSVSSITVISSQLEYRLEITMLRLINLMSGEHSVSSPCVNKPDSEARYAGNNYIKAAFGHYVV